jgi:hypothetical protein
MSNEHHFQKIHSDQLRMAVVRMKLDTHPDIAVAEIGRMIRQGRMPGFEDLGPNYKIRDETLRTWVNEATLERDPKNTEYDEMQRLAKEVFDLCKDELEEIRRLAKPSKHDKEAKRVSPDPARLKNLLATSQAAWAVIRPVADPPAPGEKPEVEKPVQPAVDPEAQKVADAFGK